MSLYDLFSGNSYSGSLSLVESTEFWDSQKDGYYDELIQLTPPLSPVPVASCIISTPSHTFPPSLPDVMAIPASLKLTSLASNNDINNSPSLPGVPKTAAEPSRFLDVVKSTSNVKLDDDQEIIPDDFTQDIDEQSVSIRGDTDLLLRHISSSGLPLKLRPPTLSDGNYWYDAMADQVKNNFDNLYQN